MLLADTYYVKETLEEKPASAMAAPPESISIVSGRLKDQKAILLKTGSLTWDALKTDGDVFVECWFKPEGWDALTPAEVKLAGFRIGPTDYALIKPAGKDAVELRMGQDVLQSYPIYNWTKQPWMGKDSSPMWHYLNVGFAGDGIHLTIDGFAARETQKHKTTGKLNRVVLQGGPGTVYSWFHIIGAPWLKPEALRARFRSLYRGLPDLRNKTITVPRMQKAPVIDGKIEPGEWDHAARITGFGALRQDGMRNEDINAQIGYDDRYLYMVIRTPYQGTLRARHNKLYDMPLWGEESYEIFLHPPFTGVPDYCQLIGNPYGDQADLKMMDLSWNGKWDWKTTLGQDEWIAEFRADFKGINTPPPGDFSVWTMNMVNSCANAGWCPTVRYNDSGAFGTMRFDAAAPVIRPGRIIITEEAVAAPIEIIGGKTKSSLTVALQVYGLKDVLPAREIIQTVDLAPGEKKTLPLELPRAGIPKGTVVIFVRDGETDLFFHNVTFPVAPDVVRAGFADDKPEPKAVAAVDEQASPKAEHCGGQAEKKPLTDEEKARGQKWTAQELGETLLESAQWRNNTLGLRDDAPEPWTPMQTEGQTVKCWGRLYVYKDSLLPVQIESLGEKLLAAPARFVLMQGGNRHDFSKASVAIERVNDSLVRVRTTSRSEPFLLELTTEYEFDGMGKIELALSCPDDISALDSFHLEFPLRADLVKLFHFTSSQSGHAPRSTSDAVGKDGMKLDDFREVVWLGDIQRGFCWFAESLQNWRIRDEKNIQVLEPARAGAQVFRVKLAEKTFRLEQPWRLVFGIQATPVKPRPANFRKMTDKSSIAWRWFWGDGAYYPFQSDYKDKARTAIETARKEGREIMPCSSIRYYGTYRQHLAYLGELSHPGLMNREVLIWGPLWRETQRLPAAALNPPEIPERQTAPGKWYGQKFAPGDLEDFCTASSWQDYYIWKLNAAIKETGLGAIYLDQPITCCANPNHGCGYINYKGEWSPSTRIFAQRQMMKRMYRLFSDAHGKTLIKWHGSNQIVPPIFSFIDIFWDGENYGSGWHKVFEFYSKTLPPARMQAQHTGIPFGFAPDLLPEFEARYAPSPASAYDMMGLFMVHDGGVWPAHMQYPGLAGFLQDKRISFPLDTMAVLYYWQADQRLQVAPQEVKAILHFKSGQALLILFNWSDMTVESEVKLDLKKLGLYNASMTVKDVITGALITQDPQRFAVPILPRGLRMLKISLP